MIAHDHENDTVMKSELVAALYATPGAILTGSVAVTVVILAAAILSGGDPVFYVMAAAMAGIGAFRQISHRGYQSLNLAAAEKGEILKLENRAMAGAWATAMLIAAFGSYSVLAYVHEPVAVLGIAQTIGYLAGISGRNSSRPMITRVQTLAAAAPFIVSLLWTREPVYLVIALSVALSAVLTFSSARVIHQMFLARLRTMRELEHLAANDMVTGLYNRRGFMREIRGLADNNRAVTLISIDIDRFKGINDSLGHDVGDGLLRAVSQTLTAELAPSDIAARTGGDEFMVATTRGGEDAASLAARLVMLLASPRVIGGRHVTATASMGIAPAGCAPTIDEALKCVDMALYRAKLDGRNRFVMYTPEIREEHEDGIALEVELRDAIRHGEFELHFQPIYNPRSGTATLVEALLRWNHPRRGPISPHTFIPLAERTGLITVLGSWALGEAIKTALSWPRSVGVSVNVSARQFDEGHDIVGVVEALLRMSGLEPQRLTIEITETSLIHDAGHVVGRLAALRQLGVRIALDDFGTGYSSLSYLAHLPIDTIKIDQVLAREVGTSPKADSLMHAITQLAHDLKLRLIVEGVETQEQLALLEKHAVHGIQGFLFGRPMTAAELLPMIGNRVATGRTGPARVQSGSRKPGRYNQVA
ncbi:putative bifunctional diguanylate cyclase/phosphodiesterase [Bosea sp. BH3]|uniref:putative bifunctional diguanylate cyclase/phosphodiesterase n=1 Tax=Bosea sp. BH3 TaxID=2871701 RepID=UPI0021CB99C1|nr:GGDEF domain-containing phosphodiesterase [Bosea sp. BH3]MCU4181968.1 EAL domain-containing protein [Bosea sp. BH3]